MLTRIKEIVRELNSKGVFALLLFACLANFAFGHVRWSMTNSLNGRLFVVIPAGPYDKMRIKNDSLVVVDVLRPHGDGLVREIKRVGCVEGQVLSVSDSFTYSCDGNPLGTAKHFDLSGKPTLKFAFNGTIPKGKLFLIGDSKDSYDSRYYGLVNVECVLAFGWKII